MLNNLYLNQIQRDLNHNNDKYRTIVVNGTATNYKIDRQGNIFSTFIKYQDPTPVKRTYKYQDRDDAPRCQIYVGKKEHRKNMFIYLDYLVAHTFVPNPHHYKHIIHRDYNLQNVQADNLAWADRATWRRYEFERLTKNRDEEQVRLVGKLPFYVSREGKFHSIYRPSLTIRKIPQLYGNKITLRDRGKRKMFRADRLVAQAFIPNPHDFTYVKHLNLDYNDDRVENLAWCSWDDMVLYKYFYSSDFFNGFRVVELFGHYTLYAMDEHDMLYSLNRRIPIKPHAASKKERPCYNLSINGKVYTYYQEDLLAHANFIPSPKK